MITSGWPQLGLRDEHTYRKVTTETTTQVVGSTQPDTAYLERIHTLVTIVAICVANISSNKILTYTR